VEGNISGLCQLLFVALEHTRRKAVRCSAPILMSVQNTLADYASDRTSLRQGIGRSWRTSAAATPNLCIILSFMSRILRLLTKTRSNYGIFKWNTRSYHSSNIPLVRMSALWKVSIIPSANIIGCLAYPNHIPLQRRMRLPKMEIQWDIIVDTQAFQRTYVITINTRGANQRPVTGIVWHERHFTVHCWGN